jgi:hypothetical protein
MSVAPGPVLGFARLRWAGSSVAIPVVANDVHLAARGDDAGLVVRLPSDLLATSHLASLTIDRAFGAWPPRVCELVRLPPTTRSSGPLRVFARSPHELVVGLDNRILLVKWGLEAVAPLPIGEAEALAALDDADIIRLVGLDAGSTVAFFWPAFGGKLRTLRIAPDAPHGVTELGAPRFGIHAVVLADGSVLGLDERPLGGRRPQGPVRRAGPVVAPDHFELSTFVVPRLPDSGEIVELPRHARLVGLVPAHDGGAWAACAGGSEEVVLHLDAMGRATGDPWRVPAARGVVRAIAAWREGFVVCVERDGLALVASDGVHATRVEGDAVRGGAAGDPCSLLVSPDGGSVLVCRRSPDGLHLMRADFGGDATDSVDPWTADHAWVAARAKSTASAGTSVAVFEQSHTTERVVRLVRVRHLVEAISGLSALGCQSRFRSDPDGVGEMVRDDNGLLECFAWTDEGLVASYFDSDYGGPMGRRRSAKKALRCFPDLPSALQFHFDRVVSVTRGHISEGLWMTTGEDGQWRREGLHESHLEAFTLTAEAAVFGRGTHAGWARRASLTEEQARLAIALAERSAAGPHAITADEERVLVSRGADHVAETVRAFAEAGITWHPSR